jgi:hypothetical protein
MNTASIAKVLVPMLLFGASLSSCSQNSSNDNNSSATTVVLSDANPARVLLAAVLLASGDIEKALTDGLVTPKDVDAAVSAIKNGTLDEWRQRAENELTTPSSDTEE